MITEPKIVLIQIVTGIRRNWFFLMLATLTAIILASLWPLEMLPGVPGGDKAHHLIAYTALMFPVVLRKPPYWRTMGILFIAISGVIELVQPYVNRYGEWMDMAANTAGVLCGWGAAKITGFLLPDVTTDSQ